MAKAKVWNDNVHPYEEVFKGEKIKIGPGDFIEMDYEEAIEFKGTFGRGLAPLAEDGAPDPTYFKMIRVEGKPSAPAEAHVNHLTGQKAESAGELLAQLAAIAKLRPDLVVSDSDLDGAKAAKADSQQREIEELKKQVAALVAAQEKRSPGRPPNQPKEAVG